MQNLLRGVVWLALTRNLTYVHTPLAATHGVDAASLDRWSGHGLSQQQCDASCVAAARKITYRFEPARLSLDKADGDVRARRNSTAARSLEDFDALVKKTRGIAESVRRARDVLVTVDGCPKKYYVGSLERQWLVARHAEASRRAPRTLAFDPRQLNIALHLRSPDVNVTSGVQHDAAEWCRRWVGRCTPDGFYARAVRQTRRWIASSVPSGDVQLWLFTESTSPAAHPDLERALPGLRLRLGSAATVADDLEHLSAADVMITANSGLSLVAAALSTGLVLTSAQHKYIARSPGLPRKVVCAADGSCPRDKFTAAWRSFSAAGGAGRRFGPAPWLDPLGAAASKYSSK